VRVECADDARAEEKKSSPDEPSSEDVPVEDLAQNADSEGGPPDADENPKEELGGKKPADSSSENEDTGESEDDKCVFSPRSLGTVETRSRILLSKVGHFRAPRFGWVF
jgi:hypothetical protein